MDFISTGCYRQGRQAVGEHWLYEKIHMGQRIGETVMSTVQYMKRSQIVKITYFLIISYFLYVLITLTFDNFLLQYSGLFCSHSNSLTSIFQRKVYIIYLYYYDYGPNLLSVSMNKRYYFLLYSWYHE